MKTMEEYMVSRIEKLEYEIEEKNKIIREYHAIEEKYDILINKCSKHFIRVVDGKEKQKLTFSYDEIDFRNDFIEGLPRETVFKMCIKYMQNENIEGSLEELFENKGFDKVIRGL